MVLYICRECGEQISSGATRCGFCGAPPRPPLYGRPWSHRLALRAGLVIVLSLPLLMLPVVLRWHNGSWDPCRWNAGGIAARQNDLASGAGTTLLPSADATQDRDRAGAGRGQCLQNWMNRVGR